MKIFLSIALVTSALVISGCATKKSCNTAKAKKIEKVKKTKVKEMPPVVIQKVQKVESEVEMPAEVIEEPSVDEKESTVK